MPADFSSQRGRLKALLRQRGVLGHKRRPESEADMKSEVGRELEVMLSLFLPLTVKEPDCGEVSVSGFVIHELLTREFIVFYPTWINPSAAPCVRSRCMCV